MNKETLEERIGEMEYQLHKMREELNKPKKFEWSYEDSNTSLVSDTRIHNCWSGLNENYIEHGRFRKTQKAAEMSLARNKRANRLEALAEQVCGLKEFVCGTKNYFVLYDNDIGEWESGLSLSLYNPSTTYMTQDCSIEILRMLNAGEFSLDGEI